jgi:hypothetical protein
MQSMLGYGDDEYVKPFQRTALEAFESILPPMSLNKITKKRQSKAKYNYPFIEKNTYFPGQYHLETLAYSKAWRTPENVALMVNALNHYNEFMPDGFNYHVKIDNKELSKINIDYFRIIRYNDPILRNGRNNSGGAYSIRIATS